MTAFTRALRLRPGPGAAGHRAGLQPADCPLLNHRGLNSAGGCWPARVQVPVGPAARGWWGILLGSGIWKGAPKIMSNTLARGSRPASEAAFNLLGKWRHLLAPSRDPVVSCPVGDLWVTLLLCPAPGFTQQCVSRRECPFVNNSLRRGAWGAQSVKRPIMISAQVGISRFVGSGPASGSSSTVRSLLGILSPPLSLPPPSLPPPSLVPALSLRHSLFLSQNAEIKQSSLHSIRL